MAAIRTNEEIASLVNKHMEKYPHATRNGIVEGVATSLYKLIELESLGLIKLPPKAKLGSKSYKNWSIRSV